MNEDKLKYRLYSIKDLSDWLVGNKTNGLSDYVVSRNRAWGLLNNPEAKLEDVVLSVVFYNEEPIGYTAVFPEQINNSLSGRFYWGTTQWLDLEFRGKGISAKMMCNLKEVISNRYLGLDSSIASIKLDQKQGYNIMYYPRYFYTWKIGSRNILSKCKEKAVQYQNNRVIRQLDKFKYINRYVPIISDITYQFIQSHSTCDLFLRSKDTLNWILNYPFWSAVGNDTHVEAEQCEFGANVYAFELRAVEVYVDSQLVGVYIYNVINGIYKLLYLYYDLSYDSTVFASIVSSALHANVKRFYTFNKDLYNFMKSNGIKNVNSKYIVDQIALTLPPGVQIDQSLSIQGGDGDMFC